MFTRMAYAAVALVVLSGSTTNAIAEERPAGLVAGLRAPRTQQPMLPDGGHSSVPVRREPSSAAMLLAVLGLGSFLAVRRTRSNQ